MRKAPIIKVCGMRDKENIVSLAKLPIQYIGHIFYAKSPRYAGVLENWEPLGVMKKAGVFVNTDLDNIWTRAVQFHLSTIQLHGDETPDLCARLQERGLEVIKAFGIHSEFDWRILETYAPYVDFFLFDTKSKHYGGTGQTFDWQSLGSYPLETPYFLSGGLSLDNLKEALAFPDERLQGLDLNSRFETAPGIKDIEKIKLALKVINNE